MSDFSKVETEELRAQYAPVQEKIKSLRAELRALEASVVDVREELVKRDNNQALILNAVMAGQQGLLRAAGTSEEVIAEAERWFRDTKAAKEAARAEKDVA